MSTGTTIKQKIVWKYYEQLCVDKLNYLDEIEEFDGTKKKKKQPSLMSFAFANSTCHLNEVQYFE